MRYQIFEIDKKVFRDSIFSPEIFIFKSNQELKNSGDKTIRGCVLFFFTRKLYEISNF